MFFRILLLTAAFLLALGACSDTDRVRVDLSSRLLIDRFIQPDEELYDPIRRMLAQTRLLEDGHAGTSQP